jgi:hypothetical protein
VVFVEAEIKIGDRLSGWLERHLLAMQAEVSKVATLFHIDGTVCKRLQKFPNNFISFRLTLQPV